MKKLVSILMLSISIFLVGMPVDAKTSRKKSTKTTQTSKSFTLKSFISQDSRGYYINFKPSMLESNGFEYFDTVEYISPDETDEDALEGDLYGKNGIQVCYSNIEGNTTLKFVFSSRDKLENFIQNGKNMFTEEGDRDGQMLTPGAHDQVSMTIKGNTVILESL